MIEHAKKLGLIASLVLLVIVVVSFCFKPFSTLHYIGPMAAIATAYVLLWGARSIFSVLIVIALIMFASSLAFDFTIDISFALIATLSIVLQSFWITQLTAGEIQLERWLSKRSDLMSFLIKVGPVGSLVSAFAVLILSVMQNQTFDSGLLYTFMAHWSLTMLFSVFIVTLVLFATSKADISQSKRVQVLIASILGLVALCLLFKVTQKDFQYQRMDAFHLSEREITHQIKERIETVDEQLHALNAFFGASAKVESDEFEVFSESIFKDSTQVKFFAWAPIVDVNNTDDFERLINEMNSDAGIKLFDLNADDSSAQDANYHTPVQHIYPTAIRQQYIGIDFFSHPEIKSAMLQSSQLKKPVATLPITANFPGLEGASMYVFSPVLSKEPRQDADSSEAFNYTAGYLIAVVDAFELFNPKSISIEHSKKVSLFIEDVSTNQSMVMYGAALDPESRLTHVVNVEPFERQWKITVAETEPSILQRRSWVNWGVLFGGTLGGLLYQFLILLMTAYSGELQQQIRLKTRELILEKEGSDNASQAKSKFLKMLSNELQVPVSGIANYSEKLSSNISDTERQELISSIGNISNQLNQFVRTIKDMSELETGLLTVQKASFDFHDFIKRIEDLSNISEHQLVKKVSFVIHKDVPEFIDGDELRIQQIFNALVQNGAMIFNCDTLRISVKAHMHKHSSVTIFLVVTPSDDENSGESVTTEVVDNEFAQLNTSMTLAQEICHQLGGTIKLTPMTGLNYMISASFKADISQRDEEYFDSESLDKYQQV